MKPAATPTVPSAPKQNAVSAAKQIKAPVNQAQPKQLAKAAATAPPKQNDKTH